MDLDNGVISFQPAQSTIATILCCECGSPIVGADSPDALCNDCLRLKFDASEGIEREAILLTCRDCQRWLSPPSQWLVAEPESRELLSLCLKRLKGLQKVRLIDASFIWTEEHSRRIKLKVTVQKEAFSNTILQQAFEVVYVVNYQQCPDCQKSFTAHTWAAQAQIRQRVNHKRSFLHLEQLILKHSAHRDCSSIQELHDGLNMQFQQRNQAEAFCDFVSSVMPCNIKKSSQLISHDVKSATKNYKFSYSVEILPICRDDLIVLPIPLAKKLGNISPISICRSISTSINLLDPTTLQTAEISVDMYTRNPFRSLADVQELKEFIVLDIEPIGQTRSRWMLADATVTPANDMGNNTYLVRTHLGNVLHPGDSVLAYHLTGTNFNNPLFDALEENRTYSSTIPDVVLVKKYYPRKKKSSKNRNWRLKRLEKEESEMLPRKQDTDRLERDFEMFLRDVEEDEELRAGLSLYKAKQRPGADVEMDTETEDGASDAGLPTIPIEQLIDDMDEMTMEDA